MSINGHGRLMNPVSRSSAWRIPKYRDLFPVFRFDTEWCASFRRIDIARNATCGVCGPVYNGKPEEPLTEIRKKYRMVNATSFERNSHAFKNIASFIPYIVETYRKGQWIKPRVKIEANHKGNVSFRVCPVVDEKVDPTMECFDQNNLLFENGETTFPLNDGKKIRVPVYDALGNQIKNTTEFQFKVKLPKNLVCEHCLFQWKWIGVNDQRYYGCSDIRIQE